MALSDKEKAAAFAEGIARGLTYEVAHHQAGYAPTTRTPYDRLDDPKFIELVAEIRVRLKAEAASDIPAIIDELLALAKRGEVLTSAAGINAVRECLLAAAALRLRHGSGAVNAEGQSETSLAQWLAAYGPKS
jgi:hypothetical protein